MRETFTKLRIGLDRLITTKVRKDAPETIDNPEGGVTEVHSRTSVWNCDQERLVVRIHNAVVSLHPADILITVDKDGNPTKRDRANNPSLRASTDEVRKYREGLITFKHRPFMHVESFGPTEPVTSSFETHPPKPNVSSAKKEDGNLEDWYRAASTGV